ncbi:M48 family metallopeptidase [Caulobacter sp. UNC358MFTsu5.1]|uniref:M48 family metallopeptidase n=1 Tax=Caulobacter sp. UNC358MFTsu5.1 TaxID=1449049 RepID=UPI0004A6A9F2|nr:SprT family zinc-dependent metalloprotease [Caulobacter sp. UNC358MFTsu5.1]
MAQVLSLGDVSVDVVFKDIKNVHLSVYPPTGRVRISAPHHMTLEGIRLFAVAKIGWIKRHQRKICAQPRETPREFLERESHYLWGRRYLLRLADGDPGVEISSRSIELSAPHQATAATRRQVLEDWYRAEVRRQAAPLLAKWQERLGVSLDRFYVQRMRTKWGSSNPGNRTVRLNLDLARFPVDCLDYVALHELAHFVVANHNEHFAALLDRHMPGWQQVRARLNEGPLAAI